MIETWQILLMMPAEDFFWVIAGLLVYIHLVWAAVNLGGRRGK